MTRFTTSYCKWTDLTLCLFCYLIELWSPVTHESIIKIIRLHDDDQRPGFTIHVILWQNTYMQESLCAWLERREPVICEESAQNQSLGNRKSMLMMPCQQQIHESQSLQSRNVMSMHIRFSENRHICYDYCKLLNNILSFNGQYCKWTDLTYVLFCYLIGFVSAVNHDPVVWIIWLHDADQRPGWTIHIASEQIWHMYCFVT